MLLACMLTATAAHAASSSVYLEDLTSPELAARIAHGDTIALVPIGGTEQSGPYLVLGKHNARARLLSGMIARQLGHAIVAPVIAYVPEGSITPPTSHMKYSGTLSVPDAVFEAVLEATARSLKQHGFRDVFFLGDHGGYRADLTQVAARLNREWARDPSARAHALPEYYSATQVEYLHDLQAHGLSSNEIGIHAGSADTSLSLALDPASVRADELAHAPAPQAGDGSNGDPRRSSAALGELGVKRIVERSVAAIREAVSSH